MSGRFPNTTKVFVGSLPTGTTVDELRDLFKPYGVIADCNVVNRCGFVHLEDRQLAFKAIDEMHNFNFKGSRLTVEKGHVKPPRSGNSNNGPTRNQRGREHFRGRPYGGERRGPMRQPPPFMDRRPLLDDRRPLMDDRRTLGESNMMDYHRRPLIEPQGPPPQMYDRPPPFDPYNIDMYNRRDVPIKPMGGYPPLQPLPFQYQQQQQQQPYNQQQEQRRFVPGPGPGPRRDMPPPRRY